MEAAVAERLAPPAPAAGYRIRPFAPGDERHWARIETSVGEFSEEAAARAYFERVYLARSRPAVPLRRHGTGRTRRNGDDMGGRGGIAASATTPMGGRRTRPPGTGSGTCDRHGGGATGRTTRPRRSDPAAYADMEPPGAAALPQPRIPLLPHADDRHAEQGGDGHEALPQRIRRGDGGIAPHGRPRRDRRMAPHGVPVIGRIGYSSGVSM